MPCENIIFLCKEGYLEISLKGAACIPIQRYFIVMYNIKVSKHAYFSIIT